MRTTNLFCTIALIVGITGILTSCASKKVQQINSTVAAEAINPFGGGTFTVPGFEHDTEEYFAAVGLSNGSKERMDVLQLSALTNAQNVIRQKLKHAYKGMVADYSNYIGNNIGTDANVHVERAGNQIIDAVVNDTQAQTLQFSGVDEKGNVTCYTGIRVYKKQLAEKIAKAVSEDEELKIRFEEKKFREYMQEQFKEYKEEQKQ